MNLADFVRKLQKDISELQKLANRAIAGSAGEANTASNIGAGGVGLYESKVGVDLRFRNINTLSARLSVALDAPNHEVDLDVVQAQIDHGSIAGLVPDDDHTQYLLVSGLRSLSATWDAGAAAGRTIQVGYLVAGGAVVAIETLHSEGRLALKEVVAPGNTAGYGKLWVSSADGLLYFMDDAGNIYDLTAVSSGGGGGGAPSDAEYIVGAAHAGLSAERAKPALYINYDLQDYPAAPDAMDDEFDDGALDVKWTAVNDPAAPNALSETQIPGFLWVGLPEYTDATVAFSSFVRLFQAPPAGNIAQAYIAKVAVGCIDLAGSSDAGEWTTVGVYIGDPTGNDAVIAEIQINDAYNDIFASRVQLEKWDNNVSGVPSVLNNYQMVPPTPFLWLKLEKTTADAFTNSNTYNGYYSLNGIVWYQVGQTAFTFSNAPTEIGLCFRRPKLQGGTPLGHGVADCFRRIV